MTERKRRSSARLINLTCDNATGVGQCQQDSYTRCAFPIRSTVGRKPGATYQHLDLAQVLQAKLTLEYLKHELTYMLPPVHRKQGMAMR